MKLFNHQVNSIKAGPKPNYKNTRRGRRSNNLLKNTLILYHRATAPCDSTLMGLQKTKGFKNGSCNFFLEDMEEDDLEDITSKGHDAVF